MSLPFENLVGTTNAYAGATVANLQAVYKALTSQIQAESRGIRATRENQTTNINLALHTEAARIDEAQVKMANLERRLENFMRKTVLEVNRIKNALRHLDHHLDLSRNNDSNVEGDEGQDDTEVSGLGPIVKGSEGEGEVRQVCVVQNIDKFTIRNLPDFNISKGESFANWSQRFTDMIDVICDADTTEATKVDILKVRLTGWARRRFDELTAAQKATLTDAIAALRGMLDNGQICSRAESQLRSLPHITLSDDIVKYAEKLEDLVEQAEAGKGTDVIQELLKKEFLNRLPPWLLVSVKEKRPATFMEAVEQASSTMSLWKHVSFNNPAVAAATHMMPGLATAESPKSAESVKITELERQIAKMSESLQRMEEALTSKKPTETTAPAARRVPRPRSEVKCYGCGRLGHYRHECASNPPQTQPAAPAMHIGYAYPPMASQPMYQQHPAPPPAMNCAVRPYEEPSQREKEMKLQLEAAMFMNSRLGAPQENKRSINVITPFQRPRRTEGTKFSARSLLFVGAIVSLMSGALGQLPMLCHGNAPGTILRFPEKLQCSEINPTRVVDRELKLTVYQPNVGSHNATAVHCRIVKQTAHFRTSIGGWPLKEITVKDKPVTREECIRMRDKRECSLGPLVVKGEIAQTDATLDIDYPVRIWGSFWDRTSEVENCFAYSTMVWEQNLGENVHATVGDASACKFDAGNCQLGDGSMLLWEVPPTDRCRFRQLARWPGTGGSETWVSATGEFALTFKNASKARDCDKELVVADQGYAITVYEHQKLTTPVRAKRLADAGVVLTPQLAAQLTAISTSIEKTVSEKIVGLYNTQCALMQGGWAAFKGSLMTSSTQTLRAMLGTDLLQATAVAAGIVQVWPCSQLESHQWSVRPLPNQCFKEIPVTVEVKGKQHAAFLDPLTMIVSAHSTAMDCEAHQGKVTVRLGDSLQEISTRDGSRKFLNETRWTPAHGKEMSKLGVHGMPQIFHNLVLNEISEISAFKSIEQSIHDAKIENIIQRNLREAYGEHAGSTSPAAAIVQQGWFSFLIGEAPSFSQIWIFLCNLYVTCEVLRNVVIPLAIAVLLKRTGTWPFLRADRGATRRQSLELTESRNDVGRQAALQWPPRVVMALSPRDGEVTSCIVQVNGATVRGLLDTGACISICPAQIAPLFGVFQFQSSKVKVMDASGQCISIVGRAEVELKIGEHTRQAILHFVPQGPPSTTYEVILGTDVLIDFPPLSVHLKDDYVKMGEDKAFLSDKIWQNGVKVKAIRVK